MRGDAMKRLTEKRDCGNGILYWLSCPDARHCAGGCAQCDTVDKAIDRLGEYEDAGLTPDEIERSKMEIEAGCVKAVARTYGIDINRLRELAEADRAGLVAMLPCKVGDTVFASCCGCVVDFTVDSIRVIANNDVQMRLRYPVNQTLWLSAAEFGKTIYLTHEEAEGSQEGGGKER